MIFDGLVDNGSVEYAENNPIVKEILFAESKSEVELDESIPIFKSILDDAFGVENQVQI